MKPSFTKHYFGRLGDFDYDTGDFEIWSRTAGNGYVDMIRYRGRETDGTKIKIPEGVVDLSYCFEGCRLVIPPVIPLSVRIMQYTFQNCASLSKGVSIPDGVTRTGFMYQNCRNLVTGSDMPDSIVDASYMYDGCTSLINPGRVSANLQNGSGLFRNCRVMRVVPDLPDSVLRSGQVFRGCDFLHDLLGDSDFGL